MIDTPFWRLLAHSACMWMHLADSRVDDVPTHCVRKFHMLLQRREEGDLQGTGTAEGDPERSVAEYAAGWLITGVSSTQDRLLASTTAKIST